MFTFFNMLAMVMSESTSLTLDTSRPIVIYGRTPLGLF